MSNVEHEQIVFEAVTRQASTEIQELRRTYRTAVSGMSDDALRLANAQAKLDAALSRHGAGSRQAREAELAYRAEINRTTEAIKKEGAAADQTTRELGQLSRGAVAGSGVLRGFGRSVAFASGAFLGTAGLVYAIRSAVRTGLDFEREMRNVNSIARLSDSEFAKLTQSVLELAGPSAQAPKTLAEGLYELESSGFSASDSLTILEASSKAATAGLTDNATATKAVAAALNAYHLPAEQARRVSDILFSTVDKGVLSFAELAQNMGDLVPAAAPLGVRLEEVGAAIATITLQGVPAAEAATRVNRSLLLLARPNKELTALLKAQGFASVEAAVKARGYAGVLEIISKATRGNVAATSKLAPEIRSLLGVVGLTGKNLKTYEENLRAIEHSQDGAGRTASVFAEQSKSTAVQLQRLSANIDTLEIAFSSALAPAINETAQGISDWLEKGDNLERVQRDITEAVEAGGKVVKGLAGALDHLADVAGPVVDAVGGIEHAVELAFGIALITKIRRAAGSMGLISSSSARVSAQGVEQAGAFSRAWDIATRPRNMVVTTTYAGGGGGVPGVPGAPGVPGGGPVQRPTTRGRTVTERIGQYGKPLPTPKAPTVGGGSVGGLIVGGVALAQSGEQTQGQPAYDPSTDTFHLVLNGRSIVAIPEDVARRADPALYAKVLRYRQSQSGLASRPDEGTRGRPAAPKQPPRTKPSGRNDTTSTVPRRTLLDIQTDIARTQATGDTAGETRYLTELRDRYRRQIAALETRKTLTDKQKQTLQRLYGDLSSAQGQIEGIAADNEAKLEQQRKDAAEKRERQLAKVKAETDRINAFAGKNVDRINKALREAKSGKELLADQRTAAAKTAAAKSDPDAISLSEVASVIQGAFTDFQAILNRSNFAGGPSMHLTEQALLNGNLERARQTRAIERLAASRARPVDDAVMA